MHHYKKHIIVHQTRQKLKQLNLINWFSFVFAFSNGLPWEASYWYELSQLKEPDMKLSK